MTNGDPETVVSVSLQKIKSIKNLLCFSSSSFFSIKSETSDSFVSHFDGHFAYLKTLDFYFKHHFIIIDLPFDPKTALPIRHPLLVAECRCWRPLRFSHVLSVRQASTSERQVGGASSTETGQLFQSLAVLSHHLHCYNNGLRTRKAPSHNDGRVMAHYTTNLTATAEEHPNTVMSAPLRHPSVAGTEHINTLSACGPRHGATAAVQLWSSPATSTSGYIQAHSPFNTQQVNIVLHPHHTSYWGWGGGGCSGDACVTHACRVSCSAF